MKLHNLFLGTLVSLMAGTAAANICPFEGETFDLTELPSYESLLEVDPVKQVSELTQNELEMIYVAVESNEASRDESTLESTLKEFRDEPNFYNAGSIRYFKLDAAYYAFATYYPGDNEYGVLVKLDLDETSEVTAETLKTASFELVAEIADSGLHCN